MTITLLATNIEYAGIPTSHDLPENMEVQVDLDIDGFEDINRQVCNQISDATGMLVRDYQLVGYSLSPAE